MNDSRVLGMLPLVLLLLFASGAAAQLVSVVIQPQKGTSPLKLYPDELAAYNIFITNNGPERVDNLVLVVSVDEELAIVMDEKEAGRRMLTLDRLFPAEQKVEEIRVKALRSAKEDLRIVVKYGVGESLIHEYSTTLQIVENPITINARLSKTAISQGEEGSVLLDMTNSAGSMLYDINAELMVSEGLSADCPPYHVESLDPRQSFSNKEFRFTAEAGASGRKDILLRVTYSDGKDYRTIERRFVVDVQDRSSYIFILAAGAVVFAVAGYLLRQRKGKAETPKLPNSKSAAPKDTQAS